MAAFALPPPTKQQHCLSKATTSGVVKLCGSRRQYVFLVLERSLVNLVRCNRVCVLCRVPSFGKFVSCGKFVCCSMTPLSSQLQRIPLQPPCFHVSPPPPIHPYVHPHYLLPTHALVARARPFLIYFDRRPHVLRFIGSHDCHPPSLLPALFH